MRIKYEDFVYFIAIILTVYNIRKEKPRYLIDTAANYIKYY